VATQTVQVKIRYHDFSTHTAARTIEETNDDPVVFRAACELLRHLYTGRPVRLLASTSPISRQASSSVSRSRTRDEHRERMLKAVDVLRAKFGKM